MKKPNDGDFKSVNSGCNDRDATVSSKTVNVKTNAENVKQ